jgi:hypothetical protein
VLIIQLPYPKKGKNIKFYNYSYPGQPCTGAGSCFTGECTEGKCPGAAENATCTTNSGCLMGLYCKAGENRTCTKQVGNGGACVADEDCANTHGCNNSTCVAYFSLADGTPVTNPDSNKWSLCASGESDAAKNCRTLNNTTPVENECTSDCSYTQADQSVIIKVNSCKCSMNASGKKYCALANGHSKVKSMIASQKALIAADVAHCHTLERTSCAYSERNNANWQSVQNSQIEVESYAQFVNIETCVRDIAFPLWKGNTPPVPQKHCPRYKCDSKLAQCGVMASNDWGKNSTLNGCTNSTGFECLFTESMVLQSSSLNVTCTEKAATTRRRFPGEDCLENDDCVYNKNCTSKKCTGTAINGLCTNDIECLKGSFCNSTNCVAQAAKGGKCSKTFGCANNNACWNSTCIEYYSLNVGADVTLGDLTNSEVLCKSGFQRNGVCNEVRYGANMTEDSTAKLVKCDYASDAKCRYLNTDNSTVEISCECALNEDGSSWCPAAQFNSKF